VGALGARGLPGLVVTYRNDAGAPRSPDGFSHLGLTEWEDLEAAARYALARGARRLVLVGYSTGGQIILQFLARSPLAPSTRALVLESPMLDWNAGLAHRARALGAPPLATALGKWAAAMRGGLNWPQLDRVTATRALGVPVLLFHGLNDQFAPEGVSERFGRKFPHDVTLVRDARGNHVEAWNVDPERYTATLNAWLTAHHIGGGSR
jgi:hypothetical protein